MKALNLAFLKNFDMLPGKIKGRKMKPFDSWNEIKKSIDSQVREPNIKNGEVWWCNIGINVGCEEDGKNQTFDRPVLIFRKLAKNKFYGVPLSTQKPRFNNYYHEFNYSGATSFALLDQLRVFSTKRLENIAASKIKKKDFAIIRLKISIIFGLEKSSPPGNSQGASGSSPVKRVH